MKKTFVVLCVAGLLGSALTARAQLTGFNDILTWTGSGANQSALVIQWNDGKSPVALAWGYRWNAPSASVSDMLLALMDAGVGLFGRGDSATGYGASYYGFGYDANHDGSFGVTGAVDSLGQAATVTFAHGFSDMNTSGSSTQAPFSSLAAAATSAEDRYNEAWMDNGFWAQFDGGTGTAYPTTWTSSWIGASETLANNGWYGFTFGAVDPVTYDSLAPLPLSAYAAIPEPAALPLVLMASGLMIHARKRLYSR